MSDLLARGSAGFAASMPAGTNPFGAVRPQPGFAAAMARGAGRSQIGRPDAAGSASGRSSTLDAVLRTGRLGLRDGN